MQGFNMGRYVPPDQEGILSFNQASGKGHALGNRARKINQGILTVRFELPFPIWCTHCPRPTIIGQGVRFNAEKRRVGAYHSTPILAFTFTHTACSGRIEIRTDPANTAYVVHSGARKRDTGEEKDGKREGEVVVAGLKTEEEKQRLANDPFARVEERRGDEVITQRERGRVEELYAATGLWDDPGEMNRRLRREFRMGRKGREKDAARAEEVKERIGFGGELVAESEEDGTRAGLVEFGEVGGEVDVERRVRARGIFESIKESDGARTEKTVANRKGVSKMDKKVSLRGQPKDDLRKSLGSNTRAVMDPFLYSSKSGPTITPSIKRKRPKSPVPTSAPNDEAESTPPVAVIPTPTTSTLSLVDYDSD